MATTSGEGEDECQEVDEITFSWPVPNGQGFAAMLSAAAQLQLLAPANAHGHLRLRFRGLLARESQLLGGRVAGTVPARSCAHARTRPGRVC